MSINVQISPSGIERLVIGAVDWPRLGRTVRLMMLRMLLATALVLPFSAAPALSQETGDRSQESGASFTSASPSPAHRAVGIQGPHGGVGRGLGGEGTTGQAVISSCLLTPDSCLLRQADQAPTVERLLATQRPTRDPVAITSRLAGTAIPWVASQPIAGPLEVGRRDTFFSLDQNDNTYKPRPAVLRVVGQHAYWYVQDGERVNDDDLQAAATFFDQQTVPTVHQDFGEEWSPGIDGDPRITIFLGTVTGVSAYFSSADELPRSVFPYSNEREMILVNANTLRPGSISFNATLAHEFQHMVHWHLNPSTETWLDEGLAELSSSLVLPERHPTTASFQRQPDVQLTAWSQNGQTSLHYQASFLFAHYLNQRFGSATGLHDLLTQHGRPPDTITAFLSQIGAGLTFNDVFEDWLVANLLDDPSVGDGRYVHDGVDHQVMVGQELQANGQSLDGTVHQYGADYIELRGDGTDASLQFEGAATAHLVDATPTSGQSVWWTNRGDAMDTTLTHQFDLTGVLSATLHFNLWYETERDFDFAYVLASVDGGTIWQVLRGAHAEDVNRAGNAIGPGYTGKSGVPGDSPGDPTWVPETVDLTPLAGHDVLVRFEYITDQGFNLRGALLDDITIPEIGFADDAEADAGWTSEGFLRSDNTIPQTWSLQLVEHRRDGTTVVRPLRPDSTGRLMEPIAGLGADVERAILIVSGLAPRTLESAHFHLALNPRP